MRVTVIGSLNIDLVAYMEVMPHPGQTVIGKSFHTFAGGKGLNQAVAAARTTATVQMIGVLGTDSNSEILQRVLDDEGIDSRYVLTVDCACGTALIEVDESGQNRIVVIPGANNALLSELIPNEAFEQFVENGIVLAQLENPIAELEKLFLRAKSLGQITILNPAPAQPLPPSFAREIDILIPNEYEASLLTGIEVTDQTSAAAAGRKLLEMGIETVVITLGSKGALLVTEAEIEYFPAFDVNPIDTTAAGDVFCGALASELSRGNTLKDSIQFACAAGALATTKVGATLSAPTYDAVISLISAQR